MTERKVLDRATLAAHRADCRRFTLQGDELELTLGVMNVANPYDATRGIAFWRLDGADAQTLRRALDELTKRLTR